MKKMKAKAMMQFMTGPHVPDPRISKEAGKWDIFDAAPIILATPRKANWVPKVAINVGIPVPVTINPLITPHNTPESNPQITANATGT